TETETEPGTGTEPGPAPGAGTGTGTAGTGPKTRAEPEPEADPLEEPSATPRPEPAPRGAPFVVRKQQEGSEVLFQGVSLGVFEQEVRPFALGEEHALLLVGPGKERAHLRLHDRSGRQVCRHPVAGSVACALVLPEGRLAFGTSEGEVRLFALEGAEPPRLLHRFGATVSGLRLADGALMAKGDDRQPQLLGEDAELPAGHMLLEGAYGDRYAYPTQPVWREVRLQLKAR
ncbi:MAG TPA: hypothetical protein DEA08_08815, partial [Planctomycetes bacterium]|nr:hypothetical protein [Planctomycetota bacterium]